MSGHRVDFHDSISPVQARVLFHAERLIGTAGRGKLHAQYLAECAALGLKLGDVRRWSTWDCIQGLQTLEAVCRAERLHLFRDITTNWENIA